MQLFHEKQQCYQTIPSKAKLEASQECWLLPLWQLNASLNAIAEKFTRETLCATSPNDCLGLSMRQTRPSQNPYHTVPDILYSS